MKVDVCTFREVTPDLFSRLIMWWTGAQCSHVGLVYVGSDDIEYIFHSIERGSLREPLVDSVKDSFIMHRIAIPLDCSLEEWEAYVSENSGIEYSQSQIAKVILRVIPKLFLSKSTLYKLIDKFSNGPKKLVCSELVARALVKFKGINFSNHVEDISPIEIVIDLKRMGY